MSDEVGAMSGSAYSVRLQQGALILLGLAQSDEQMSATEIDVIGRFARALAAHFRIVPGAAFFDAFVASLEGLRPDAAIVKAAAVDFAQDQSSWDVLVTAISDLVAADGTFSVAERRFVQDVIASAAG